VFETVLLTRIRRYIKDRRVLACGTKKCEVPTKRSQKPEPSTLLNARAMRSKEIIARDLVNNTAHDVRWHDATTVLKELGCVLFLEMPPGHTLSDLAKQNLLGINSLPLEANVLPKVLRLAQMQNANDGAPQSIRVDTTSLKRLEVPKRKA
jgi:malonyl CoA-acyl carrier protein transacylase